MPSCDLKSLGTVFFLLSLAVTRNLHAIDFASDIQPIFQARCYSCHGPTMQKSGLRLDSRTEALKGGDSGSVIIPGNAEASPLIHHIERRDEVVPMPPKGEPLAAEQISRFRAWIDEGAIWPEDADASQTDPRLKHWAWQPLEPPALPSPANSAWIRNPIDAFVLDRLDQARLAPSSEADHRMLLRRVCYDLTGLPPTAEQSERFLNDPSPQAYERLVDRLLGSPHYGERWARHWLDVVHYGESHGFDKDKRRSSAWPYRDYVIRSLNADKAWPTFIEEQIAGDYLNPQDPDSIIATGFLAAGPWDFVGHVELREGTIEKERVRVLDRDDFVANTMTSFMSLTVQCARCHDHKFDPITQREYYQLQAVFSGIERADRPYEAEVYRQTREDWQTKRDAAIKHRAEIESNWKTSWPRDVKFLAALVEELEATRKSLGAINRERTSPANGYHSAIESKADVEKWVQVDLGQTTPITRLVLFPAMPTDFSPDTPGFGFPVRFKIESATRGDFSNARLLSDQTNTDFANPGISPVEIPVNGIETRYLRVTATHLWPRANDYVFALAEMQIFSQSRNVASGAHVDGLDSITAGRWSPEALVDGFTSREPIADSEEAVQIEKGLRNLETQLKGKTEALMTPEHMNAVAEADAQIEKIEKRLKSLPESHSVYALASIPPREIRLLRRGDVQAPSDERLSPGALALIANESPQLGCKPEDPEGEARARLARWIADKQNGLAWRSITNRVWAWHFGFGLVDSPNDFGLHGSTPSHPELLDWLTCELRDSGGSLKALHKLIVTSATYRQTSFSRPDGDTVDQSNRLFWRMNRTRLDADALRDSILSVCGTINWQMGGPSFDLFGFKDDHSPHYDYENFDDGPQEWRRSIYRSVIRSVPDPFLYSLDCADPNINMASRGETYTALQALSLMNDAFVLKQSRFLANRIEALAPDETERTGKLFMLTLGRDPTDGERGMFAGYAAKHGWPAACRIMFNTSEFLMVD